MNTFKALFSRRFMLPTIVVLLAMAVMAWLGFWQLDRLEQRRAENTVLTIALEQPPLELTSDGVADGMSLTGNQQAIARGVFDFDEQVVLLLQLNEDGRTGVHLLTPLLIGGATAVIVDRGWTPEDQQANYDVPAGETAVYGYLAASKPQLEPNAAPKTEWHRVDVEAIATQLPYDLLPFYLVQLDDEQSAAESPAADPLPIRGKLQVDLSEGSHLSYAIQWFLFSLTLAVVYLAFVYMQVGKKETDSTDEHS